MRTKVEEREVILWPVKEQLLKETGWKCAHCGTPLERYGNLTVDHVIPINKGGTNDPENLTVLCTDCNKSKSDMILRPMEWYGYLPVTRRKALEERLKQYIKETDYLSKDCLMPVDSFRIEVPITTAKRVGHYEKRICMPAYINGTRMINEDAISWLSEYKRSLLYRDSEGVFKSTSELEAPCYLLKKGDIDIGMVNPWMVHEWDTILGDYRTEILLDWFFSPKMPDRDYLPKMLAYLALGVENLIAKNMAATMDGACAVLFHFRCILSDRFCNPVFNLLTDGRSDEVIEHNTGYSLTARCRDLTIYNIIGKKDACKELVERLNKEHADHTLDMYEAARENKSLNGRFKK